MQFKRVHALTFALVVLLATATTLTCAIPRASLSHAVKLSVHWMGGLNHAWRAVIFTLVNCIAVILCIPATPFNLAAGSLFGLLFGSIVACVAIEISSFVSFVIGRYLAKDWAIARLSRPGRLSAFHSAIANSGFHITLLIRIAPVFPYGLCSYLFGATKISFPAYMLATTLGMLPGTIAYVYMGTLIHSLADELFLHTHSHSIAWVIFACLTTTASLIFVTAVTKRSLRYAMLQDKTEDSVDVEMGTPDFPPLDQQRLFSETEVCSSFVDDGSVATETSRRGPNFFA